jgi:hypothetical protein
LKSTKFHLFVEIAVDAGENISEDGSCTMPDMTKEEKKGKAKVAKRKPSTWATSEDSIRL